MLKDGALYPLWYTVPLWRRLRIAVYYQLIRVRRTLGDSRYYLLRLAAVTARLLPVRFGYLLADLSGDVIFILSPGLRSNVGNNLRCVLGIDSDKKALRRTVRGILKNMAKNYFDLARLSRVTTKSLNGSVTIEGWHNLEEAVGDARGTIIATAHLGNFEFVSQVLALGGVKVATFVEPFDSTPLLRNIAKLRGRNCRMLPTSRHGMRDGLCLLRRGGTLAIVCDRDIQGNGQKVKFFGEDASFPVGAVSLALRTGAAIVPVFSVRRPGNRSTIYIEPPLKLVDTGDRRQSVRANLERLAAIMERYIGRYPEQWVVLQPFWRG